MIIRRIIAVPADTDSIRFEFTRFLDRALAEGWVEMKVRFGFAWSAHPGMGDGTEKMMSPVMLAETVSAAESQNQGKIGSDDLYVTPIALGVEHLFCHDADIHLQGPEESAYIESEAARFSALGWKVYDSRTSPGKMEFLKVARFAPE